MTNNSYDIKGNKGDVVGVGIDGNGNIVWKDVDIVINEFAIDCGLTLIHSNYFEENFDTEEDFKSWLEGFSFSLPSIYQRREFRREKVISVIKQELEDKKRLLVLGESGTSKSTSIDGDYMRLL